MKKTNPQIVNGQKIIARLNKADHVTIIAHRHPDVDAIASCLAMSVLIKKLKKKCIVINTDSINREISNVPTIESVQFDVSADTLSKKDVLLVLDSGEMHRIGDVSTLSHEYNEVIFIDHHKVRDLTGVTMLYVDEKAAATCEMIYSLFEIENVKLDAKTATILYCGLISDSGGFMFPNTTPTTLAIAYNLLNCKVDLLTVNDVIRRRYDKKELSVLSKLYSKIIVCDDMRVGYIAVSEKNAKQKEDILNVSLTECVMQIESVLIGFVVRETKDDFRVSIRSRCKKDIRPIAEKFGGGGHLKASGFKVSKADYSKDLLIDSLYSSIVDLLGSL